MMKRFYYLFILLFFLTKVAGQEVIINTEAGFYVKNGVATNVYILKENAEQRAARVIIPQQQAHQAAVLTPEDIDGYGFFNAPFYISAEIQINGIDKKVFLEEVIKTDSITVYFYPFEKKDYFFVHKKGNSALETVSDVSSFWNLFANESDCSLIREKINKNLTRKKIQHYYQAYINCNTNYFQKLHYGITVEGGLMSLNYSINPNEGLKNAGKPWTASNYFLYVGGFMQIPIGEFFNFRPELLLSQI